MTNIFSATDEFLGSLDVTEKVGYSLSLPDALKPSQLPITNAISCATVVLISGYFENYLKNLVKEYIEAINGLGKPLSSIPFDMQLKHYAGGADALVWASKQDKSLRSTLISQDLSRRLASLSQPNGYILAWEAFANTKSNPGAETVKTILSGLEIEKAWPEINDLQTAHGRFDTFLESFIKMRNVCAHTGRHHTPPSGADVIEYVDKFRGLAACIDLLTGIRLEVFATP
ncbi:HEPN domain-containing protein [Paraburkholderia caledonica]|uniref:HEPN domain-containing protein n=1 Tax=Paraburkholderia caledonica TaxID=134536 RepID=UPI0038BCF91D